MSLLVRSYYEIACLLSLRGEYKIYAIVSNWKSNISIRFEKIDRVPLSLSNRIFFPPRSKSENELIWFLSNLLCIFFFLSTVQKEGGTQLKLQINYSNMQALFKPMRWVQFTISTFLFWFKKGTIVSTIYSRKIKNLALSRRSKLLQVIYLPPLK